MARRKNTRQNQKDSRKRAALFAGRHRTCRRSSAENISTQPTLPSVSKRPTTLRQVTETDLVDETTPNKKLV
jgi:hypothetical protein